MQNHTILFFRSSYCEINQRSFAGLHAIAHDEGWNVQTIEYGRAIGSVWPVPTVDELSIDVRKVLDFWRPAGCIVESCMGPWDLHPEEFKSVPTVFFNWYPSQLPKWCACVFSDGRKIAACAARELMSIGVEYYAFVPYIDSSTSARNGGGELYWSRERREEFEQTLRMNGKRLFSVAGENGSCNHLGFNDGESLKEWVATLPKPCGVFAANDLLARNVITACQSANVIVPDDIAVIGVDDLMDQCENHSPTLSSVRPDHEGSGRIAAALLKELLDASCGEGVCRTYGVDCIVRRESTRRHPGMDVRVRKALEYIRKHACEGISSVDVYPVMGCSCSLANLRFRQARGHSILDEIHSVRLERAKELLSKSRVDMKALPDFCGYASLSDLRRVFHRRVGCTLSAYRKQCPT